MLTPAAAATAAPKTLDVIYPTLLSAPSPSFICVEVSLDFIHFKCKVSLYFIYLIFKVSFISFILHVFEGFCSGLGGKDPDVDPHCCHHRKASLQRTGVHCTCGLTSRRGRACVKSLRSSYTGLYPQIASPAAPKTQNAIFHHMLLLFAVENWGLGCRVWGLGFGVWVWVWG
jgi:hypothetical protein